jgi:pimeloyl-ACP methyl ester carboxylesterase
MVIARALSLASALALAVAAPAAAKVSFQRIDGFKSPGTPAKYDKVGILKIGSPTARNVLVLNPGTSASAAYFAPLAESIVAKAPKWQVWAVERRENLLEDQSMFDRAKAGTATPKQVFDYYLGWIRDSSVTSHVRLIPDSEVGYARRWGMNAEIQDLRRVVLRAQKLGGKVVVGGHSLGGSITSAYATWDFGGKAGARGLSGLVFIDGGSSPQPISSADATQRLKDLGNASPWLTFGGIPGAVHRAVQHERIAQRPVRPRLAVARPGERAAAREPRAARAGDQRRPVRLCVGHRDVARRARRRAGASRSPGRLRRPARLGRRG